MCEWKTNRSGCKEIVDDGVNGFIVEQQNSEDLIGKVRKFLDLSFEEKKNMGIAARKKVEKQFDRNIIVKAYLEAIVLVASCNSLCTKNFLNELQTFV
mgnify:CR=1 FL=1